MSSKIRKVAILGAGPAGLMAAHVARTAGYEVKIFSRGDKSTLYGCQYLHAPIPNFPTAEPTIVSYDRIGTPLQYRQKIYGENWTGTVSTQTLSREHPAWDIRNAYDRLWDTYSKYIEATYINGSWLDEFEKENSFTASFSSIHAPYLCDDDNHYFDSMQVFAWGETPTRKLDMDVLDFSIGNNHILCNGLDLPRWYRVSNVFGYATVEWPVWGGPTDVYDGYSMVDKPLKNDCECRPNIIRIGRYGTWQKGILTHNAMEQTWEVLR